MNVLFIVLNHEKHFDALLEAFKEHAIHGGTILESQGLGVASAENLSGMNYGYLRHILNEGRPYNKTLFLILDDEKMDQVKKIVREVTGGIERENQGIMFNFTLDSFEGLTK
ncbi:MAG: hypothetical protein Q4P25_02070 [Tissierellia bacterium]|nr:hypothetical protein [Tissierellia bacterium]